jgi:hypothetical protein
VDHYESSVRGRLPQTRGREKSSQQYCGGLILVDHATKMIMAYHQVSLGASDTIRSKRKFERLLHQAGLTLKEIHTDNGVFKSREFEADLLASGQTIRFSGVGAHHKMGLLSAQ